MLVFELKDEPGEISSLALDSEVSVVQDQRFTWKGKGKLQARSGNLKFPAGSYQLSSYVQLDPPASPTSLDLRSDWRLFALGTSYGFILYDYASKQPVVSRCTLNVQDFAIISGDAPGTGAMSRKKSFRKSLRESFRRLRRGRSQRGAQSAANQQAVTGSAPMASQDQPVARPAFSRLTTGVRTLNAAPAQNNNADSSSVGFPQVPRSVYANERQVEQKVDLGSIVKCLTLTSAVITSGSPSCFTPSLWVGTNSGSVLVYAITLADEQPTASRLPSSESADQSGSTSAPESSSSPAGVQAKLVKEIQLKHRAPIVAIFTSPEEPAVVHQPRHQQYQADESASSSKQSSPEKQASELMLAASTGGDSQREGRQTPSQQEQQPANRSPGKPTMTGSAQQQARVLICTEEQFKVFNLPNLKPFCKFKLTAHEGLRAKAISITQFFKPATGNLQPPGSQPNKQAAANQVSSSKSLQSFATQTSPPSSPMPPAESAEDAQLEQNGPTTTSNKQAESNNNSLSALNNNHTSTSKDLLNAKFGASSSASKTAEKEQTQAGESAAASDASGYLLEPYMVCMSNQGDCAVYSVPELKRQAQIQVCKREDVNGIDSTMLTQFGEGFYLRSSLNFLRFSISSQRVLRSLALVS